MHKSKEAVDMNLSFYMQYTKDPNKTKLHHWASLSGFSDSLQDCPYQVCAFI